MQDFVRIDEARRFSQEFYETLLTTGYAEIAVNAGRHALYSPASAGWAVPALYLAPSASPLWNPDRVLAAVQDLLRRFRAEKSEFLEHPFPIEVVRYGANVPLDLETSPPGPRVPFTEAVAAALAHRDAGARVIILLGGNGRGKTAQMYQLYAECARRVSQGGALPLFVRISRFEPDDTTAPFAVARAVARTYQDEAGLMLDEDAIRERFAEPCVLLVDGDQEIDDRRRNFAFDALLEISARNPQVAVVATANSTTMRETASLFEALQRLERAVGQPAPDGPTQTELVLLLVQLLTPSSLGQYLEQLPEGKGIELHAAIRNLNLFDIASVPWLLSSLLTQANRTRPGKMSRSGVIGRVVESNFASVSWPAGTRQLVPEFLAELAWTLQKERVSKLSGSRLYRLLGEVRGAHDISMEQLRTTALQTRIVCPSDDDGVRFAYPGLQSYWCAQRLVRMGSEGRRQLDDITATLGRRSRVRMWQDVLVLLSGLIEDSGDLVQRILAGGELGYGEQVFVGATCAHEARLSDNPVPPVVIAQMLDSLIWRSTAAREHSGAARIRAVECMGLLGDERSVPHLVSLVIDRVRADSDGELRFELSGLRQAALQVLVSMPEAARRHVSEVAARPEAEERSRQLLPLIGAWMDRDEKQLRDLFRNGQIGIPAVVAFALAGIGGPGSLDFLMQSLADPAADLDTRWAIADALLTFNAHDVIGRVCDELVPLDRLRDICAYMIGKLQVGAGECKTVSFLEDCLKTPVASTQGRALRALAELGNGSYRQDCESLAVGDWAQVSAGKRIAVPDAAADAMTLRRYALESLRLIGDAETLKVLRDSHARRFQSWDAGSVELTQLSYQVSEDIYWRISAGQSGEFILA